MVRPAFLVIVMAVVVPMCLLLGSHPSKATPVGISLVGSTSTRNVTQTVPTGVADGDLLLAYFAYWHAPTSATAPLGWTMLTSSASATSGIVTVWYRFANGDTTGTQYNWTFTGPGPYRSGGMIAYRGVDSGSPFDGMCNNQGNNSTPTLCSFSTNFTGDQYLGFFATENTNLVLPADLTTETIQDYNIGQYFGSAVGDKVLGGSGLQPSDAGSMNSGGWETIAVALKATASGPTPVPTATATALPGSILKIGSTSTTTNQVAVPAGVADGDVLLAFFSYWSPATVTAPPGWTFLHNSVNSSSGTEAVWYRIASGETPGTFYTWNFNGPGPYVSGGMLAYRGVDTGQIEDGNCELIGHSTAPTLCSFTTAFNNDEFVGLFATENTAFALPGDLTQEVLTQYSNGHFFGTAAGDKTLDGAGSTGNDIASMNNGGWASIALALKPANAGPPAPTPIPPPIAFINSSTTTNAALTVPPNVQSGDLLLGYFGYWHFASATAPAGWTPLETEPSAGSGVITVWYRFATGADTPGTVYVWSFSGPGPFTSGGMLAYRGVTAPPFEDGTACLDSGNNGNPTLCSITTSASSDVYVGFFTTENTGLVLPPDLTPRVVQQYVRGSFFGTAVGDKALGAPGMIAPDTGTMNSGGWETIVFALTPAPMP